MALAYSHVKVLLQFRKSGVIEEAAPSMMEFGEQNWYGDLPCSYIERLPEVLGMSEEIIDGVKKEITHILSRYSSPMDASFDMAKLFYKILFNYKTYTAIDLHGTNTALKYDLNEKLPITNKYDIVTNIGTGEHVFNQYMFFKNIHDVTKRKGFMIHSLPNQGCYDHGFYNYHPTFIFDIADANQYSLYVLVYCDSSHTPPKLTQITKREDYIRLAVDNKLSCYSGLFAILRKPDISSEFQTPRQGYYGDQLSPELGEAWNRLGR